MFAFCCPSSRFEFSRSERVAPGFEAMRPEVVSKPLESRLLLSTGQLDRCKQWILEHGK